MVGVEYSIAISEVLDILKNTNEKDVNKISPEFMSFLKDNASKEYIPKFDYTNSIESLELSEKAIGILSVINSKFWCTPEQKENFDIILNNNENKYQAELREKYNPDNLFKNKVSQIETLESSVDMVEYKESILKRFINKLKSIFKMK